VAVAVRRGDVVVVVVVVGEDGVGCWRSSRLSSAGCRGLDQMRAMVMVMATVMRLRLLQGSRRE
jgi:hypothetical protein